MRHADVCAPRPVSPPTASVVHHVFLATASRPGARIDGVLAGPAGVALKAGALLPPSPSRRILCAEVRSAAMRPSGHPRGSAALSHRWDHGPASHRRLHQAARAVPLVTMRHVETFAHRMRRGGAWSKSARALECTPRTGRHAINASAWPRCSSQKTLVHNGRREAGDTGSRRAHLAWRTVRTHGRRASPCPATGWSDFVEH